MNLSVIVPWKAGNPVRERLLTNTLKCWALQRDKAFEILLVEQVRSNAPAEDFYSEAISTPPELENFKHILLFSDTKEFNKSWCMNVGARSAQYEHLVFCDADSIFNEDFVQTIRENIIQVPAPQNRIFFCWDHLIALPGKDNPNVRYIKPTDTAAMGGVWYAHKDMFFNVLGGMNENFVGYGGEDNELYNRTCYILGIEPLHMMHYTLTHQYHDWEPQNAKATEKFLAFRQYPLEVAHKLREAGIGNPARPTLIEVRDLSL